MRSVVDLRPELAHGRELGGLTVSKLRNRFRITPERIPDVVPSKLRLLVVHPRGHVAAARRVPPRPRLPPRLIQPHSFRVSLGVGVEELIEGTGGEPGVGADHLVLAAGFVPRRRLRAFIPGVRVVRVGTPVGTR